MHFHGVILESSKDILKEEIPIDWFQNKANIYWNKFTWSGYRTWQPYIETRNSDWLISEYSKSILKKKIAIDWFKNATNIFWNNLFPWSDFFEYSNHILSSEIVETHWQQWETANHLSTKTMFVSHQSTEELSFETKYYLYLTSEYSLSVFKQ